jgi:ubiquinone/menaquinone biosynthesis C-methylase UbiE/uncharacterized protein YbaR (Trm112 family)
MRKEYLTFIVCPKCKGDLILHEVRKENGISIESGILGCTACMERYDILRFIPRFVPVKTYANGFGLEWTKHARTQYDRYSGVKVSETRFFEETKWPRNLEGEVILEVGSGSGRFTEHAASTGAMVISMDLSYAVEANYASNGGKSNVLIVQADIYKMPFKENSFDKIFCIGVLQHTPHVKEAFMVLPRYLKSEGSLVIDVYPNRGKIFNLINLRHWARLFTKHIPPEKLYNGCVRYIKLMWPLVNFLSRIGATKLIGLFLIPYYKQYGLSKKMLKEWALLDLFDILSATYEHPQTIKEVQNWFRDANMRHIEVHYGYNGIEGRGIKP